MVVTQSDKLVKCPKCEKIQKATGEKYFICCRTRWDLEKNRFQSETSEDSNRENKQTNSEQTGGSRRSKNQSKSNDKTGSDQSGRSRKTLEFG